MSFGLAGRKGSCTLPKVSKTWGLCSSFNYNCHYTTLHCTTPRYTTTSAQQPCLPYFQAALWRKLGNASGNLTKRMSPGTQACPTSRRTAPHVCHPVNRQNAGMHPKTTWNLTNCRPPGCTPPDQKRSKVHPDTGVPPGWQVGERRPLKAQVLRDAKQLFLTIITEAHELVLNNHASLIFKLRFEGSWVMCPGKPDQKTVSRHTSVPYQQTHGTTRVPPRQSAERRHAPKNNVKLDKLQTSRVHPPRPEKKQSAPRHRCPPHPFFCPGRQQNR